MSGGTLDTKVECYNCGWKGTYRKARFGHDAYVCPRCGKEAVVEQSLGFKSNYPIYDEKSDEVYKP